MLRIRAIPASYLNDTADLFIENLPVEELVILLVREYKRLIRTWLIETSRYAYISTNGDTDLSCGYRNYSLDGIDYLWIQDID
jgi:hypothetical protein